MKNPISYFSLLLLFIFSTNNIAYSQWSTDPNVNNPVCTSVNDQTYPLIISDGSGGVVIAWTDKRGGNLDVYAQRLDANGIVQWTADGVAICTAANNQSYPTIVSDGSGGAIIAWSDNRGGTNYDIYAQRINGNGIVQWAVDGIAVCTAAEYQANPKTASDGSNGAIIVWQDRRSGIYDIFAQRIDSNGAARWAADGEAICIAESTQEFPEMISDGKGGAICTWNDKRSHYSTDIYAQLINSNGEMQWKANGVEICTAQWEQSFTALASDGKGGAIITWEDFRTSPVAIYAQRIDSGGVVRWKPDGMAISAIAYGQISPKIVNDERGGAIITWQVNSSGNHYDIYAQRIDTNGLVHWTVNGAAICTAGFQQQDPSIINDGSGGAIITWEDQRSGTSYDIYAQRIDTSGLIQWAANGIAVSTARYDQIFPTIASNGIGGAIITWQDYRVSYPDIVDIYAQQVNSEGILGVVTGNIGQPITDQNFVLHQNYPNPFNSKTSISWQSPVHGYTELKIYDFTGREIRTLVQAQMIAGEYHTSFDASGLPAGVYFYQIRLNGWVETREMVLLQ
ncbi:MAG: T9SS type A sorting domain-containing protein [Bacteroidota bacterium]